ncbi:hypothetical protein KGV52_00565 [Candidatus Gracilibacteria bacterium]|nr:hypothetical protein [Candidatus Gracilibacteria bacterium]
MNTELLKKNEVVNSFQDILDSLSDKEKSVISRRIGLENGTKETLQSIGNSFTPPITRERVRQIEEAGIKKIGRIAQHTILTDIQKIAVKYVKLHGGLISSTRLINNIIKDLKIQSDINKDLMETIIQSDYDIEKSKQKLGSEIFFYLPHIHKADINLVYKEAKKILKKKKDIMTKDTLYKQISKNLKKVKDFSPVFIDSVIDIHNDILVGEENLVGLESWKILNPKTLKDKAFYVLKKIKTPMHFVDIGNKITELLGEEVKVNTIHNELIRSNDFVLIGRGIYALKEWGFKPGTVLDVIIGIMEKRGEPMNTEEIKTEVLKVRDVKDTTVYMNLQNKKFIERVGRNYYQLKEQN